MVIQSLVASSPEQQLLKGCKLGDRTYQKLLYEQYAATMFGICLRYASDYHQAEDILQEGFVKVFRQIRQFRSEGSFEGWMKRIFVTTAIGQYRQNMRYKRLFLNVDTYFDDISLDPSVFQELAANEIIQSIHKLPAGYRAVFNLYIIEGYNHKEISQLLGITEGTSKSQLARARKALQQMINTQKNNESKRATV